jgi:hypothetical protein
MLFSLLAQWLQQGLDFERPQLKYWLSVTDEFVPP